MQFIPDNLSQAYMDLRMRIGDASKPLSWADHVKVCMPEARLMAPATKAGIAAAQRSLGIRFPSSLKVFLRESDGVDAIYSRPVCPIKRILEMNREYRTADYLEDRMPFDHLLFFPGLWGKRLAEYLVQKLSEKGIQAEHIIAEDWGWFIPIQNEGFRLAICCGHQNGDDDQFLCFTDPSTPVVKKFFKKIDATAQLTRLTEAMQQIFSSDPEIRDVQWTEPE